MASNGKKGEFITASTFTSVIEAKFDVICKRVDNLENQLVNLGIELKNILKHAVNGRLHQNVSDKEQKNDEIDTVDNHKLTNSNISDIEPILSKISEPNQTKSVKLSSNGNSKSPEKKAISSRQSNVETKKRVTEVITFNDFINNKKVLPKSTPVRRPIVSRKRPQSKRSDSECSMGSISSANSNTNENGKQNESNEVVAKNSDLSSSLSSLLETPTKSPASRKLKRIIAFSDSDSDTPLSALKFKKPNNVKSSSKSKVKYDWPALMKSIRPCNVILHRLSPDILTKSSIC